MTQRKPLIGLPLYRDYYGNPLWSAPVRYVHAIQAAGGECLPLAPFSGGETLDRMWEMIDGLMLTGGGDVDPMWYGQETHDATMLVDAERDGLEMRLTQRALRQELPILGICRGIQSLNVAAGGTLTQDIPSMRDTEIAHSMDRALPRSHVQHQVRCEPESLLAKVLGASDGLVDVNSMHHQCVDSIAPGFSIVAWATDGIPEAIELGKEGRFVLGVQWHPEEMVPDDGVMRRLFAFFVAACDGHA